MKLVKLLLVLSMVVSCKTTSQSSAVKDDEDRSRSGLAGMTYCRTVGALGGGSTQNCIEFSSATTGVESDTSGGIPRSDRFTYTIRGTDVTLDYDGQNRTTVLVLSNDRSTLTLYEGRYSFVWNLEQDSQNSFAGTSYCRMIGSLGGGQVETCYNFTSADRGSESDTSGGIPRNDAFSYSIEDNVMKLTYDRSESRVRYLTISSDNRRLTLIEGQNRFTWTLSESTGSSLSGKIYCRTVGALGGGSTQTCIEFDSDNSGVESDTSGGIPRSDRFSYSIAGTDVTLRYEDQDRTMVLVLSEDRRKLTLYEGRYSFVWNLEN